MIWTLVGTLMIGVLAASLTFIGFRLARREPPRWTLPAAAGVAMLAFHISSDYAWFPRAKMAFPAQLALGETYTKKNLLQPWTLLAPPVDRFSVADLGSLRRNPAAPELVMVEVHAIQRYYPTVSTVQLYDCNTPRRAAVGPDLAVDAEGRPTNAQWVPVDADDRLRRKVCAAAEVDAPGAESSRDAFSMHVPITRAPRTKASATAKNRRHAAAIVIREQEKWPRTASSSSTTSRASASI